MSPELCQQVANAIYLPRNHGHQLISTNLRTIVVRKFCDCEVRLPKRMKSAQIAEPSSMMQAIDLHDREPFPTGTPVASTNFKFNARHGPVIPQASQQAEVSAVKYKPAECRDFENSCHIVFN